MDISIIVRTYNEEKHIKKLLYGIKNQNIQKKYEIIIVDSGSTDRTIQFALEFDVKIINIKKEEFSFGKAINLGCKEAKGELLVFASAHVYPVYNDWISNLINPFSDKKIAYTYGRQIGNEHTKFSENMIFKKWFPTESLLLQSSPFCNNANSCLRKAIWEKYNFDEKITGLEDINLASILIKNGLFLSYVAEAVIVHVHDESYNNIYNRYKREAIAMKKIFPNTRFTFFTFLYLFVSNVYYDTRNLIQNKYSYSLFKSIIKFRFMQFYATYVGYRVEYILSDETQKKMYYPEKKSLNLESELNEKSIKYI